MVSGELKKRIDGFIGRVNEPYMKVENVPFSDVEEIYDKYVIRIFELDDETREKVLDNMEDSWNENVGHSQIRKWGRACIGLAKLLREDNASPISRREAADIVVRISRWDHSSGVFYKDFVPFAKSIVSNIWGSIENLYYKK